MCARGPLPSRRETRRASENEGNKIRWMSRFCSRSFGISRVAKIRVGETLAFSARGQRRERERERRFLPRESCPEQRWNAAVDGCSVCCLVAFVVFEAKVATIRCSFPEIRAGKCSR